MFHQEMYLFFSTWDTNLRKYPLELSTFDVFGEDIDALDKVVVLGYVSQKAANISKDTVSTVLKSSSVSK